jgi:hypothetical protein
MPLPGSPARRAKPLRAFFDPAGAGEDDAGRAGLSGTTGRGGRMQSLLAPSGAGAGKPESPLQAIGPGAGASFAHCGPGAAWHFVRLPAARDEASASGSPAASAVCSLFCRQTGMQQFLLHVLCTFRGCLPSSAIRLILDRCLRAPAGMSCLFRIGLRQVQAVRAGASRKQS